jgi:NitT/TauT family transport system permease protein
MTIPLDAEPNIRLYDKRTAIVDSTKLEWRLPLMARIWGSAAFRKIVLLFMLALIWEAYARWLNNPFVLPTFTATLASLGEGLSNGIIFDRTFTTIKVLLMGYAVGISAAAVLTALATTTRIGNDALDLLTSMFSPLPAIALLPLALLWFGLGNQSLIFVMVHSVLWPVALNTHSGFKAVSPTLRMVGRNYQLSGIRYIWEILVPAGFPSILTGLKIGWAFSWRTLIAAELIFGVSSGKGGLGWMIFEYRNSLDIAGVFSGLLVVIFFGLIVEQFVFRTIEKHTVQRWGMQTQ